MISAKEFFTAKFLVRKMVDVVLVKTYFGNKGPAYVFSNAKLGNYGGERRYLGAGRLMAGALIGSHLQCLRMK